MPKTPTDPPQAFGGPTMGSRWSVLIDDAAAHPALQSQFQAAVGEVDAQMSTWTRSSDLMRLNAAPLDSWVALPDRLMTVLAAGLSVSRQTGGAFEMNVGDAVRAWGFGPEKIDLGAIRAASSTPRLPAAAALELDPAKGRARKSAPLALDLSGIAKGYGVDRLAETAAQFGVTQALCTIDGEVRAIGSRRSGRPWAVGIDMPDDKATGHHSTLALEEMAVATSGDYRHFVTVAATRLSHTIDPRRGAPVIAPPSSVTVLSRSCMMADAMATALLVMGEEQGAGFARKHGISALFLRRTSGETVMTGTETFAATSCQAG